MAHILKNTATRPIGKQYCAVKVEVKGKKLIVVGGVEFVAPDTRIAVLPDGYEVQTMDGETIRPSGTFYITSETINPYHLLMDVF